MSVAPPRAIRTAVFPVAGIGTRFLPATKALPQEMLPIVDKPLIQYAVEEAVAAGIEHVVLVTHRSKRAIEDHFDAAHELERLLEIQGKHALLYELRAAFPSRFSLSCVRQQEPLGLGHALLCARHLIGGEPFALLLADDLLQATQPVLAQMVQRHQRLGGSLVAAERGARGGDPEQRLVVDAQPVGERVHRVVGIADGSRPVRPGSSSSPGSLSLPAPSYSMVGRYVLSPAIFDALAESGSEAGRELKLSEAIKRLLPHEPVFAYSFEGRRFDCSSKLGFLEATVSLALEHPEVGPGFARLLQRLDGAPAAPARRAVARERSRAAPPVPH